MSDGTQIARAMFDRDLRAGVLFPVRPEIDPRTSVAPAHAIARAARAHGSVADDPTRIAADPTVSDSDTHREDSAAMEHERQRRLKRWQEVR